MSTSITTSFITDYVADFVHAMQQRGSLLINAVRHRTGVVGSTSVFQVIGTGTATTKARHGSITPMNQTHSTATATLADFYAGDWYDKLDEAKVNINERMAIAEGGAWALGRKMDAQILVSLDATTQTVENVDETSIATYLASAIEWNEAIIANNTPNDGQIYAAISPPLHSAFSTIDEFTSSDYVQANGTPFRAGAPVQDKWRDWLGVKWKAIVEATTMSTTGASGKNFMWHKRAIGYASGKVSGPGTVSPDGSVAADITWHGDRAAWFINHMMSGGAVIIDDNGVIEASHDNTQAVPTS